MITQEDYSIKVGRQVSASVLGSSFGLILFWIIAFVWIGSVSNASSFFFVFLILSFFILLIVISAVYNIFYLKLYSYSLDEKNLVIKSGIIARSEKTLPFSKIQHIIINRSFMQRIFGVSTVLIQTAAQDYVPQSRGRNANLYVGPNIPGVLPEDAEKIRDYINKYVLASKKADL